MNKETANWFWDADKKKWKMTRVCYNHIHVLEDARKLGYKYEQLLMEFYIVKNPDGHRWPWKMTYKDKSWKDEDEVREVNGELDSLMYSANDHFWWGLDDIQDNDIKNYGVIRPIDEIREYVK